MIGNPGGAVLHQMQRQQEQQRIQKEKEFENQNSEIENTQIYWDYIPPKQKIKKELYSSTEPIKQTSVIEIHINMGTLFIGIIIFSILIILLIAKNKNRIE